MIGHREGKNLIAFRIEGGLVSLPFYRYRTMMAAIKPLGSFKLKLCRIRNRAIYFQHSILRFKSMMQIDDAQ